MQTKIDDNSRRWRVCSSYLEFNQKTGTYIPRSSVKDVELYVCPSCSHALPNSMFENRIDKNYASVKFDDLHKPLRVDLRDLPFDAKYAEAVDKLTGNVQLASN